MEILQPLEFTVSHYAIEFPELHDHDVLQSYEALLKYLRAKITHYPLPEPTLKGDTFELYQDQIKFLKAKEETHSYQELQNCLKRFVKSVKQWNKECGSRGYINFISRFVG